MTAGERGFLLLTGYLGDPARKPMTVAQFRELARRVGFMHKPDFDRDLQAEDLIKLGYDKASAEKILVLLSHEALLDSYMEKSCQCGCTPLTRLHSLYPSALRKTLGLDAPACLWAKGDLELLKYRRISLVGSRELRPENRACAQAVGTQAAEQGYVLVSGNARGADRAAQDSCLAQGGSVICVVADQLAKYDLRPNVLYLSEDGFDLAFSSHRALSRNRIIHALSEKTVVAQCALGAGGTWSGTVKNLHHSWSSVFCFKDGSNACRSLSQRGAVPITEQELHKLFAAQEQQIKLF